VLLISLALVGELLYHLVITEYVVISEVLIDGDGVIAEQDLRELAQVGVGSSYFSIDSTAIAARIEDHPAVKSASVGKVFPETLQVSVSARRPLVISFAQVGDRELPIAIDEQGVAFQLYRDIEQWNLPVISGIRFEDFSVGTRLPDRVVEVLRRLHDLRLDAPTLFDQLSEIHLAGGAGNALEMLIYPLGYRVPVRIEDELDASLLRYIIMVLDMFEREGRLQNIRELDFRGGRIVFRAEEE
jgi:cell division septal protein FtsQ